MTGKLADALTKEQIESHSSALTNDRINQIELAIDRVRVKAGRDPVIENLAEYAAELGAWNSYLQTLNVDLSAVQGLFDIIRNLHDFLRYGVKGKITQELIRAYPKTYPTEMQRLMLVTCNQCADMLRRLFQNPFNYYFRTGSVRQNFGVEGDLQRAIDEINKPIKRERKK